MSMQIFGVPLQQTYNNSIVIYLLSADKLRCLSAALMAIIRLLVLVQGPKKYALLHHHEHASSDQIESADLLIKEN